MASKKKAADTTTAAGTTAKEKTVKTAKAAAGTAAKAPAEKKATAKKAVCKTSVCVEMSGLSVTVTDIQNAVKKAVKERGLEAADLKIYINAAEQVAYYTVDGEGGEEAKVDLKTL